MKKKRNQMKTRHNFWGEGGEEDEIGYIRAHIPVLILCSTRQCQVKDVQNARNHSQVAGQSLVTPRY